MGRKELSPHYPPLGQPKGPLTQGAKRAHYWLNLASSPPDDTLRELCPHSNRPESEGQKLPWEKYLIPLSHTCGVINPNTGVYSGCIFKLHKGSREGKEAHLPEPMKKSSDSFLSYNCPEFISPKSYKVWCSKWLWGFKVQLTLRSLTRENFLKHRFLPFKSLFQIVSRLIFLKHTLIYLTSIYTVAIRLSDSNLSRYGEWSRQESICVCQEKEDNINQANK